MGAHPDQQLSIRVVSELAWANLLSQNLFISRKEHYLKNHIPDFTVIHCPFLQASPDYDHTFSNTFVVINLTQKVGKRFNLPHTRALVKAVLNNELDHIQFHRDEYFNLLIPESCPGVPQEILDPQSTWQNSNEYKKQSIQLIARFNENFDQFIEIVSDEVFQAGPHINK